MEEGGNEAPMTLSVLLIVEKAGAEVDCAGPPRGCLGWSEGGARPTLTPTYKSS